MEYYWVNCEWKLKEWSVFSMEPTLPYASYKSIEPFIKVTSYDLYHYVSLSIDAIKSILEKKSLNTMILEYKDV